MIAEIHNKISATGSNLNDRLEDQLTGDFFGTLRYLPFEKGLQKILGCQSVYPNIVGEYINSISCKNEEIKYLFWKRLKDVDNSTVEPDLIVEIQDTVICIEVKYNSGLSSDDEESAFDNFSELSKESSYNQLAREARAISNLYKGKKLILLLVARDEICDYVYKQSIDKIREDVSFAKLSWSDIFARVSELKELSFGTEKIIFTDINKLLKRKGFDKFMSFQSKAKQPVITKDSFGFCYDSNLFEFKNTIEILGDLYYEFRK